MGFIEDPNKPADKSNDSLGLVVNELKQQFRPTIRRGLIEHDHRRCARRDSPDQRLNLIFNKQHYGI
jgi:hypothetical protein